MVRTALLPVGPNPPPVPSPPSCISTPDFFIRSIIDCERSRGAERAEGRAEGQRGREAERGTMRIN